MKKSSILYTAPLLLVLIISSCSMFGLREQEDYDYQKSTLDAHINKSARQYLLDRGKAPLIANDTIFKWMQLGMEYAGIDLAQYEAPGRTYIFLSNNAIRVRNATTGVITAGMWFDFPIMDKNPDGSQKFAADGVTPVTHPATKWTEYSTETVKNYFLTFILTEDYGFNNAVLTNTTLTSLAPPGAVAGKESRLGYLVTSTSPNYNAAGTRQFTYNFTAGGTGFDPEGKLNMKIVNSDYTPLQVNDFTSAATSGILATNGQIHVCSTTVYPNRY